MSNSTSEGDAKPNKLRLRNILLPVAAGLGVCAVGAGWMSLEYFPREHDGAIITALQPAITAKGFGVENFDVNAGAATADLSLPGCEVAANVDYKKSPAGYAFTDFDITTPGGVVISFANEQEFARTLTGSATTDPCPKLIAAMAQPPAQQD